MTQTLHIENTRPARESCFWNSFTLRETHDEHHVNGDETQQVSHDHTVNHDDKRTNFFEASAIEIFNQRFKPKF